MVNFVQTKLTINTQSRRFLINSLNERFIFNSTQVIQSLLLKLISEISLFFCFWLIFLDICFIVYFQIESSRQRDRKKRQFKTKTHTRTLKKNKKRKFNWEKMPKMKICFLLVLIALSSRVKSGCFAWTYIIIVQNEFYS